MWMSLFGACQCSPAPPEERRVAGALRKLDRRLSRGQSERLVAYVVDHWDGLAGGGTGRPPGTVLKKRAADLPRSLQVGEGSVYVRLGTEVGVGSEKRVKGVARLIRAPDRRIEVEACAKASRTRLANSRDPGWDREVFALEELKGARNVLQVLASSRRESLDRLGRVRVKQELITPRYSCDLRALIGHCVSRGRTLRTQVRRSLMRDLLLALRDVHAAGYLHLDIKPENIFLDLGSGEPRAVLGDFGLATKLDERGEAPCPGGTPSYMSPQEAQACLRRKLAGRRRRQRLGPEHARETTAADIYALGVTFHELETKTRVPWLAGKRSEKQVLWAVANRPPDPPPRARDQADCIGHLIEDMTRVSPERRPSLAQVIERFDALCCS